MSAQSPNLVVIAGPNGSGKTTAAPLLLRDFAGILEFVNADWIAQGLSGFRAETVALQAGRIMLGRLRELADQRMSFAFETTLASRTFALWLRKVGNEGYKVHLVFLWLPSADVAVARVNLRVQQGGHDVPESTIRRRYVAGLSNFFRLYLPLVDGWELSDNTLGGQPRLIARFTEGAGIEVADVHLWDALRKTYDASKPADDGP